jgi:hypothetical protein
VRGRSGIEYRKFYTKKAPLKGAFFDVNQLFVFTDNAISQPEKEQQTSHRDQPTPQAHQTHQSRSLSVKEVNQPITNHKKYEEEAHR